jgi:hypothetical protein
VATEITIRVDDWEPVPRVIIEPVNVGPRFVTELGGTSLCATFSELSRYVTSTLVRGSDVGILPAEPTLTDVLLIELACQHPAQVKLRRSTTASESRQGTDFELRLTDGAFAYDLRVQAKKMTPSSGLYAEFAAGRKRTAALKQCRKLLQYAAQARALPVYLFYNGLPASPFATADPDADAHHGCCLSSATLVEQTLNGTRPANFSTLDQFAWHRLVCHGASTQPLVGDFVAGVIDGLFRYAGDGDGDGRPSALMRDTDPEQDAAWIARPFDDGLAYRVTIVLEE